jgi:hypothetical protein
MPTAARLVAGVLFALTGFLAANAVIPALPEGTQTGIFTLICAGIGLVCGWMIFGGYAGRGYGFALGIGFRIVVTMAVCALLVAAIDSMVQKMLDMLYRGPVEAVIGIFEEAMALGPYLATRDVLITLAIGAVLGGLVSEWAGRRWR